METSLKIGYYMCYVCNTYKWNKQRRKWKIKTKKGEI